MKLKHIIKRIIIGTIILSLIAGLSGCALFRESNEHYVKRRLKERYGEEFEIKTTYADGEVIAYPLNDPDLLFRVIYYRISDSVSDFYIHELVGREYKALIEENMKDFEYPYYIDVDIPEGAIGTDRKDLTVGEYNKLSVLPSNLNFEIFISYKALSLTDEELYKIFKCVLDIDLDFQQKSQFSIYFVTDENFDYIEEYYSKYSYFGDDLGRYLFGTYNVNSPYLSLVVENGVIKDELVEFENEMQEIRSNELYK